MINEALQFQIQAYLDGSLTGADLETFRQQLATDKALAQEVELYREMEDLLGESEVIDFKKTISAVLQSAQTDATPLKTSQPTIAPATVRKMTPKPNKWRRFLAIAATLALVAVIGTVLFLNNNAIVSPDSLYTANITFPEDLAGGSNLRSTDDLINPLEGKIQELKTNWATANEAYQQQQFESALAAINNIEKLDTNFDSEIEGNLLFKKGLVLLKLNRTKEAITAFEAVKDGDYIPNAQWKRALALLKVDPSQAKIALEKIATATQHPEQKQAKNILEQLK